MTLTFDGPTHTYTYAGKVLPSVTSIIAPLSDLSRIPANVLENARQEGTQIHRMVELDCRGSLDESALPEWIKPRFEAWRRFREERNVEVILSEHRVCDPVWGYAGTLDLYVLMDDEPALIDVKRSFAGGRAIGVQTAAYEKPLRESLGVTKPIPRYGLRLDTNGRPMLKAYAQRNDISVFLACLTLHKWMEAPQ